LALGLRYWISIRSARCLVQCLVLLVLSTQELVFSDSDSTIQQWYFTRERVSIFQLVFGSEEASIVYCDCVWKLLQVESRVCLWATVSRVLRTCGLNCSPAAVPWTRSPSVRWNAWEEINCFESSLLLSISFVIVLAPPRVFVTVPSPVPKADSLSIARRSWSG
jgi:hypothetical protein